MSMSTPLLFIACSYLHDQFVGAVDCIADDAYLLGRGHLTCWTIKYTAPITRTT